MACMRHSERSLSHDIAQERVVKQAERDAAALAEMEKPACTMSTSGTMSIMTGIVVGFVKGTLPS